MPSETAAQAPGLYEAGTLRYSRFGIVMLFFWLLWGYFVYVLMEAVIPSLLPLLLKQHQASNAEISFITTSLNVIGNLIFNPTVSFWSDRYRSPAGRRRPFIIYTTPLVVLCLALIPFGPDLGRYLDTIPWIHRGLSHSPVVPVILFTAVFVMGFQVFDTFVGAVYYYLIRDTVPEEMVGRFYGVFRVAGSLAPLLYNLFIFGHAETHMKAIFVGVAIFYGLGITLMCLRVKEGEFPPPEPLEAVTDAWYHRFLACVETYFGDCFKHPVYLWCFLASGLAGWAGAAGVFAVLFYRNELGITLAVQGKLGAINNVTTLLIAIPLGYMVDRCNYFRMAQVSVLLRGLIALLGWMLVRNVPTLFAMGFLLTLVGTTYTMALTRLHIAVFPKAKYGQFGSANSAFASLGMIPISILAAKYVDWLGSYRAYLLWTAGFSAIAGLLFFTVERHWRKLGGPANYQAP